MSPVSEDVPRRRGRRGAQALILLGLFLPGCSPREEVPEAGAAPPDLRALAAATADLERDCREIRDSTHPQLGSMPLAAVETAIALRGSAAAEPADELALFLRAGALALDQAAFSDALGYLDRAADLVRRVPGLAGERDRVEYQRALAELRLGEERNCSGPGAHAVCLFVPGPEGGFANAEPTMTAIGRLLGILERREEDLRAQWLLNLAHMTLRTYPRDVPARWRIDPRPVELPRAVPRFVEIAYPLGVATSSLLGGAIMDDFDGDGLLDLFVTTYDPCRSVRLYLNDGEGGLDDVTESAGLGGQLGGFNAQQTDFDGDGRLDVFITRGGWQARHGRHRNSLLRNRGGGADGGVTFEDVTRRAGLAVPAYPTQASAWADFDADGDLDLYVGNEIDSVNPREPAGAVVFPSQLFRNEGDGTFTDVAASAGVTNDRMAKGVAWGDVDGDGLEDLYVSNVGANRLYLNHGDGTFSDVAVERGVDEPVGRSFATWFFDFDNDGALDIFCAGYSARLDQIAADYLGRPAGGERPRLYRNDGRGFFEDVTAAIGLGRVFLPMGANFGDVDNDGWLDIYLGTGAPALEMQMPNVLLSNDRGRRFLDVTVPTQTGHLPKGHGVAFGDFDNDFDQDLFVQAGGFVPGDRQPDAFFANPGSGRDGVSFDLVGVTSNRAAIGARLELLVEDRETGEREIHRVVGSGSSFGANSLRVEVGMGGAVEVRRLTVRWPVSGTVQVFEGVAAGRVYEITEGLDTLRVLDLPRIALPAGIRPSFRSD